MRRNEPVRQEDLRLPHALSGRKSAAVGREQVVMESVDPIWTGVEFTTGASRRRTIFGPLRVGQASRRGAIRGIAHDLLSLGYYSR